MLSARQLNKGIDSLIQIKDSVAKQRNITLLNYLHYTTASDTYWTAAKKSVLPLNTSLIPDSLTEKVHLSSLGIASEIKNSIQFGSGELESREKEIRLHKIEWHRKYSLSLACLVLFFIGAPLGSIIRKGGIGMPLVIAIIFFLIFHLLNMFGEKFVKENIMTASIGMWLAIIVLVPVGVFLTYKAMHDSQLFNKEYYYRIFNKIRPLFRTFQKGPSNNL